MLVQLGERRGDCFALVLQLRPVVDHVSNVCDREYPADLDVRQQSLAGGFAHTEVARRVDRLDDVLFVGVHNLLRHRLEELPSGDVVVTSKDDSDRAIVTEQVKLDPNLGGVGVLNLCRKRVGPSLNLLAKVAGRESPADRLVVNYSVFGRTSLIETVPDIVEGDIPDRGRNWKAGLDLTGDNLAEVEVSSLVPILEHLDAVVVVLADQLHSVEGSHEAHAEQVE